MATGPSGISAPMNTSSSAPRLALPRISPDVRSAMATMVSTLAIDSRL